MVRPARGIKLSELCSPELSLLRSVGKRTGGRKARAHRLTPPGVDRQGGQGPPHPEGRPSAERQTSLLAFARVFPGSGQVLDPAIAADVPVDKVMTEKAMSQSDRRDLQ